MEQNKKKRRSTDIPPEMGEILDKIKKKINEFSWGVEKSSDYNALRILAIRVKELKLY